MIECIMVPKADAEVSVIIPTFNRRYSISSAVQTVLEQKDVVFEIIVVDDGSSDGTQELFSEQFPSSDHFRYIRFEKNKGPSFARNAAIKESTGNLIAFLDSDDEWLPGKLKAQVDFFSYHSDYQICQTEEIWIRRGVRVNPMNKHRKLGGWIYEKCLALSIISPSCVMMRRSFFDQVGYFDETYPACEDYDLWLRAAYQMPIGLIDQAYVVKYGGHPDQQSRRIPMLDLYRIRSMKKLLDRNVLSDKQKQATLAEMARKCGILLKGARKHQNQALICELNEICLM